MKSGSSARYRTFGRSVTKSRHTGAPIRKKKKNAESSTELLFGLRHLYFPYLQLPHPKGFCCPVFNAISLVARKKKNAPFCLQRQTKTILRKTRAVLFTKSSTYTSELHLSLSLLSLSLRNHTHCDQPGNMTARFSTRCASSISFRTCVATLRTSPLS